MANSDEPTEVEVDELNELMARLDKVLEEEGRKAIVVARDQSVIPLPPEVDSTLGACVWLLDELSPAELALLGSALIERLVLQRRISPSGSG